MMNLLYSEFYKLKKDLSFRIMAALTVLMTFIQFASNDLMENTLRAEGRQEEIVEALAQLGILDILHGQFANTNAIIFVTIFLCCFVINDYSSGMVANFVGKGYKRAEVFLAKFFTAEFGAVLLYLLTALSTLLIGVFFRGTGEINAVFFRDFGNFLALHILYLTAYSAVIVLVCTLTRSMAAGILISILGIMVFSIFVGQEIDLLLSSAGIEAGVSQYWIVTIMSSCPVRDIPSQFIRVSGMATAFWLAASMAAGLLWFEKKDVR